DWQEGQHDTEERVLLNDAKRILEEAIQLLPPKQQEAFRLCHQQGLKYEEAAAAMGIASQTVAVHVKLALRFVLAYVKKATDILSMLIILKLISKKATITYLELPSLCVYIRDGQRKSRLFTESLP